MANEAIIHIKADDKATKVIGGIGQRLKAAALPARDLGKALKASFKVISGGAAIIAGLGIASAKQAMRVEGLRRTFDALTSSVGESSSVMLDEMRRATRGLLTDVDLMSAANRLLSMRLANTTDEAAKLTQMAVRLGKSMGHDAYKSIDTFTMLLANQSKLRLDTFGISVDAVEQRIKSLQEANEGLTDQQAFLQAVMIEGEAAMARLGDQVDTSEEKFQRLQVEVSNTVSEIGSALLPVATELFEVLQADIVPAVKDWAKAFAALDPAQIKAISIALAGLVALYPIAKIATGVFTGLAAALALISSPIVAAGLLATAAGLGAVMAAQAGLPMALDESDVDTLTRMAAGLEGLDQEALDFARAEQVAADEAAAFASELRAEEEDMDAFYRTMGKTTDGLKTYRRTTKKTVDAQRQLRDMMRDIAGIKFIGETEASDQLFRMGIEAKKLEKRLLELGQGGGGAIAALEAESRSLETRLLQAGGRGAEGAEGLEDALDGVRRQLRIASMESEAALEPLETALDDLRDQMDIVRLQSEITFEPQQRMIERLINPVKELAMQDKLNMLISLDATVLDNLNTAATAMGLQVTHVEDLATYTMPDYSEWTQEWIEIEGWTGDTLANMKRMVELGGELRDVVIPRGPEGQPGQKYTPGALGELILGGGFGVEPRQFGGGVFPGHQYLVGERGPELLEVGSRGMISPLGGGSTTNNNQQVTININGAGEPAGVVDRFLADPRTAEYFRPRPRF